jgi:C1A family cysteine protease
MSAPRKTRRIKRYGWLPDLPDHRDFKFPVRLMAAQLPASVDLRQTCSPVEDQGNLGACTSHALVGALEFLERKHGDPTPTNLSRLFLYYNERVAIGMVSEDSGANLRDGIKSLAAQGVCAESYCAYKIANFAHKPSATAFKHSSAHQISLYQRLTSLQQMRQCLADGFPFVFGFTVYESFESDAVAKTGTAPMPLPSEQMIGGHAVCAVGYDDASRRLLCRNSWGAEWGDGGYFTLPYDYVSDRNLADDLWTVRK